MFTRLVQKKIKAMEMDGDLREEVRGREVKKQHEIEKQIQREKQREEKIIKEVQRKSA